MRRAMDCAGRTRHPQQCAAATSTFPAAAAAAAAGGSEDWQQQPVAVVTGASSGIGLALAGKFAARGYSLTLAARDEVALGVVRRQLMELQDATRRVDTCPTDVTDPAACRRLVAHALRAHGRLDALVVCAGVGHHGLCTDDSDPELVTHRDLLAVNYLGAVGCIQAALPALLAAAGRLLVIGSLSGEVGLPVRSAYCASKAALSGYLSSINRELAMQGTPLVIINVAPASVDTAFHKQGRHGPRPSLSAEECARRSMAAFDRGRTHTAFIPGYQRFLPLLPTWVADRLIAAHERKLLLAVTEAAATARL